MGAQALDLSHLSNGEFARSRAAPNGADELLGPTSVGADRWIVRGSSQPVRAKNRCVSESLRAKGVPSWQL